VQANPAIKRLARWFGNGFLWGGIGGAILGAIVLLLAEWVKFVQRLKERSDQDTMS
jgi:hypothetical protein